MTILSGMEALKQRIEDAKKAREAGMAEKGLKQLQLTLRDGDIARLRIWTDVGDIKTAMFHSVKRPTLKGKEFTDEKLCLQPQECEYCKSTEADVKRSRAKFYIWVYVYYILHKELPKVQPQPVVSKVERAGMVFYKEDINAARFLRSGEGKDGEIVNKFLNYFYKYNSLCDRDYEWIRQGASLDTKYELLPEDPSSISPVVLKEMEAVPSLEDVIYGKLPVVEKKEELPLLERLKREKKLA